MKITLLGVLGLLGVATLVVYAGYELWQIIQEHNTQPPQNPDFSTNR